MGEGIGPRVGRIVSGTVNMLLEAMEQQAPEMVMEEAVREIDSAMEEVRAELGKEVAGKHIASTRLTEEQKRHQELAEKINFAVKQGRDDLAEAAIAQQLDVEAQIPVLEVTIVACTTREKELEGYITALQAKKREMLDDLRRFREAREASGIGPTSSGGQATDSGIEAKVTRAESTFDRVMEKAVGVPGSIATTDGKTAAKMVELESLARNNRIQERLAAVKGNTASE